MRVLVTGVKGQLGYEVCRELTVRGIENRGVDIDDFDLTDEKAVMEAISAYRPDAVVHCAAYTAVDRAEENEDVCRAVNVDGTRFVARACRAVDAEMVYFSTDYVFPGTGEDFYEVDSPKGPQSVYGRTKLEGEEAVRETLEKYFILRISWVFGINGNNFVRTMLRLSNDHDTLRVVCDQIGSPTYAHDLAPLICDLLATEKYGTYHATNEGVCSWAEFAEAIMKAADRPTRIIPVTTEEYGAKAARPLNSRMSKKSLDEAGFARLPSWQDALRRYLAELREHDML